jgi:hypothetical protein
MKLYCLIILTLTCGTCFGQNLVPNPGFEEYNGCPTGSAQLDSSIFWKTIRLGSPDYYNACANGPIEPDVPNTWNGYQDSHSGNAMAGFYASQRQYGDNIREYLQIKLTTPLLAGTLYYVRLYVNLQNSSYYSIGTIGAYISDTITNPTYDGARLIVNPQVLYSTSFSISDTMDWTLVSWTFTPTTNNCQFLTIGNFFPDSSSRITNLLNPTGGNSYYFIDDVCISSDSVNCISVIGIEEIKMEGQFHLFPNPFTNELTLTSANNVPSNFTLYDITAGNILEQTFTSSFSLDTKELTKGIYIYKVSGQNGATKAGKVIKQ